jgi:DNA-directed RNA polymerase subunit RPC12/RpoP
MYKCSNCDEVFDEPKTERTTYEHYYGVDDLFPNHHSLYLDVCPYCGDEEIEEFEEEEEE